MTKVVIIKATELEGLARRYDKNSAFPGRTLPVIFLTISVPDCTLHASLVMLTFPLGQKRTLLWHWV